VAIQIALVTVLFAGLWVTPPEAVASFYDNEEVAFFYTSIVVGAFWFIWLLMKIGIKK
jgi:hypothetical protein